MAALEVIALDTSVPQLMAPQAGDTYTFPRAVEMPLGTANGVLYLNGSKVVTSGSALTFDGTLLSANSSSSGSTVQLLKLSNTGSGANTKAQIGFFAASTQYSQITGGYGAASPEMNFQLTAANPGFMTWGLSTGAEAMRLTPQVWVLGRIILQANFMLAMRLLLLASPLLMMLQTGALDTLSPTFLTRW
jgi:hypothetical protein